MQYFNHKAICLLFSTMTYALTSCAKEEPTGKVTIRVAEKEKPSLGKSADANGTVAMTRPVKWDAINKAVIANRCANCHTPGSSNGAGIDLTNYANFKAVSQTAYLLMLFTEDPALRMPKGAPFSASEKQWIANYLIDGILE